MKNIDKAFSLMLELIKDEIEFSVAHEIACSRFDLSYKQGKLLIEMYDEEY